MVWENWIQVKEAPFTFRPFPLLFSTLLFVASYFIQIWAWYLITLKLGIAVSFSETVTSWFYSQLGKYLPGKVWLLLGRLYFYESKGKPRREVSIALYFEIVTMLLAGGLLFWGSLLFVRKLPLDVLNEWYWWVGLVFILAFLFLHPRVLEKIFNRIFFRVQNTPLIFSIHYSEILWVLFICILSWVVGGVGFYLFVGAVFPVSVHHVLFITGTLAGSNIAGLLAVFAPVGFGVREGALVYLLSFIMPASVAVIVSILTRLWMTVIEIGLIGMVYLFSRFQKGLEKRKKKCLSLKRVRS